MILLILCFCLFQMTNETSQLQVCPSHNADTLMYQQYCQGLQCDLTIQVGGEAIHCHHKVLAAAYPYFAGMLRYNNHFHGDNGSHTTDLSNLNMTAVNSLTEFAYGLPITLSVDTVEHLLQAARYINADVVVAKCAKLVTSILDKNNCMKWYQIASLHCIESVFQQAHELVLKYFEQHMDAEAFVKLHPQCLFPLLQDDALNVSSEDIVVEAIIFWTNHDVAARYLAGQELLKAVRLCYCSPAVLRKIANNMSPMNDYVQEPRYSYSPTKLVIVGGAPLCNSQRGSTTRDCMYWDRTHWTKFTDMPSHYTNIRQWTTCVSDNRIFISGGCDPTKRCRSGSSAVYMWHQNSWTALPDMIEGRWHHGMVFANNKLFCFGGKSKRNERNRDVLLKSIEVLDLQLLMQDQVTDTSAAVSCQWTKARNMKHKFHSPLLSVFGDNIYMFGLNMYNQFKPETFAYNISTRKMTNKAVMPFTDDFTKSGGSITVGQDIFVFCQDLWSKCAFMKYTPVSDTWCNLNSVNLPVPQLDDNISPLVFFEGRITLAKRTDNCTCSPHGMFSDHAVEYDIDEDEWIERDMSIPSIYNGQDVSLFTVDVGKQIC